MKVLMCIPYTGYIPPPAAYSLPGMACYARSKGIDIDMLPIGLSLVYTARETAANTFMEGDYDALLFVDSDMKVPIDLLAKLVEADKDIVSGLAFKRFPPYEPCIFNKCERGSTQFWFDYPKGLIEIQGVGMACTLIKRKVFEKTPKPWFFPEPNLGEDLAFCIRAKEQGFKIYCDTNLICGHCTTDIITEAHYLKYKELTMYNDKAYVTEITSYINKLGIDSVLEVGCRTGELLKGLTAKEKVGIDPAPVRKETIVTTLEEYNPDRKYDLVFSSGVLEHFDRDYFVKLLKKKAQLSNKYVLTLVPNSQCNAYNEAKHTFEEEDSYSYAELIEQYQKAGIKVEEFGTMAFEWCINRFGKIPNQGYLTYVLGVVE